MKVSIIIPAYNEERNIQSLIERIVISVPGAEIILIDDHSTDKTFAIANDLKKKYPNLRPIEKVGIAARPVPCFRASRPRPATYSS